MGGITQVRRRGQEIDVRYASDPLVQDLDGAQYELRQGPCLDSAYRHRTVRVDDFAAERRWPAFDDESEEVGLVFATHAAIAVLRPGQPRDQHQTTGRGRSARRYRGSATPVNTHLAGGGFGH